MFHDDSYTSEIPNEPARYYRCLDRVLVAVPVEQQGRARLVFGWAWELLAQLSAAEGQWTDDALRQHLRLLLSQRAEREGVSAAENAKLLMLVVHEVLRAD